MARLIYLENAPLDGYVEDARGSFDWTEPIDDVFSRFNTKLIRVGQHRRSERPILHTAFVPGMAILVQCRPPSVVRHSAPSMIQPM